MTEESRKFKPGNVVLQKCYTLCYEAERFHESNNINGLGSLNLNFLFDSEDRSLQEKYPLHCFFQITDSLM